MNKQKMLEQLNILIASNNRAMEDKVFAKLTNELANRKKRNEFDRQKFEELRALTNMGANRAK